MTVSENTKKLLEATVGRGISADPELLIRSKIKLLQNTSKMPRHGRGAPGHFLLPDEALTCTDRVRVVPGILYSVFIERTSDDKYVREHFVLPPGAERDAFRWLLPDGHTLEKEARLGGVFNNLDAEFDLAKTAMKVARVLNADATARTKKFNVPFCGLAYELSSQELINDRGQSYYGPMFDFLGAVGDENGPGEEDVLRASALADIVETTIAETKRESALLVEDRKRIETTPGRMLITPRAKPALAVVDDDIPF